MPEIPRQTAFAAGFALVRIPDARLRSTGVARRLWKPVSAPKSARPEGKAQPSQRGATTARWYACNVCSTSGAR